MVVVVSDHQFVLCKAALLFAVTRWLLSFALDLLTASMGFFSSDSNSNSNSNFNSNSNSNSNRCSSSSAAANMRLVRESLTLTTIGEIEHRRGTAECGGGDDSSCAVCLDGLRKSSHVWELSNCCHVFHKHCLERWLAYDSRLTCPLCRASLIAVSPLPPPASPPPPSWAVERMLYLFGDDLLP